MPCHACDEICVTVKGVLFYAIGINRCHVLCHATFALAFLSSMSGTEVKSLPVLDQDTHPFGVIEFFQELSACRSRAVRSLFYERYSPIVGSFISYSDTWRLHYPLAKAKSGLYGASLDLLTYFDGAMIRQIICEPENHPQRKLFFFSFYPQSLAYIGKFPRALSLVKIDRSNRYRTGLGRAIAGREHQSEYNIQ